MVQQAGLNGTIRFISEPPFGIIEIDREEKRNALTFEMWERLGELLGQAENNASVKMLVIRGAGGTFCAGADISEFEKRRGNVDAARAYGQLTADVGERMFRFPRPTLAVIRGACVGGGCQLAVACDFRICDTSAVFAVTPARLGIVYAPAATRRLLQLVGLGAAKNLLMTATTIDATEALRMGLVTRVSGVNELNGEVDAFADGLLRLSPVAVSGIKRSIHLVADEWPEGSAKADDIAMQAVTSADYREGVRAFLERRNPEFAS